MKKIEFEIWLTGRNIEIQREYRELLRRQDLSKYSISKDEKGVSSIVESVLVKNPDFENPQKLRQQIEVGVNDFMKKILKSY